MKWKKERMKSTRTRQIHSNMIICVCTPRFDPTLLYRLRCMSVSVIAYYSYSTRSTHVHLHGNFWSIICRRKKTDQHKNQIDAKMTPKKLRPIKNSDQRRKSSIFFPKKKRSKWIDTKFKKNILKLGGHITQVCSIKLISSDSETSTKSIKFSIN